MQHLSCWLLLALVLASCGPSSESAEAPPAEAETSPQRPDDGRFRRFRPPPTDLTEEQRKEIERLEAIGYVGGSQPPGSDATIVRFDPSRVQPGVNFLTSGHRPSAQLMSMDGAFLHEWSLSFDGFWPERAIEDNPNHHFWRRAQVFPNGDVIGIFEGFGIFKVTRDSELVWVAHNNAHHDFTVLPNGRILVLTRRAGVVERVHPTSVLLEDMITIMEPDGTVAGSVSLLECFENSPYKIAELHEGKLDGDIFHTNSVRVLAPGLRYRVPWMQPGMILTSMRNLSAVAVVDLFKTRVVKAWRGDFLRQHDPRILSNGNILLFDNLGADPYSRVMEINPEDFSTVWEFVGSEDEPFYSNTCGTAERLPNGNTLITESDNGRVLEITADLDVVWEFYNPHRAGSQQEFIASVFHLDRLPVDFFSGWPDAPRPQ